MITQLDEIEKDKHINMTFVEFLEALVRVAEKLEIPNILEVSLYLPFIPIITFFKFFVQD